MQARLDKWKQNVLTVKTPDSLRRKLHGNFVARRRDYGDDMSEFENKDDTTKK